MSLDKAIEHGKEKRNLIMDHNLLIVLVDHMVVVNGAEVIDYINS